MNIKGVFKGTVLFTCMYFYIRSMIKFSNLRNLKYYPIEKRYLYKVIYMDFIKYVIQILVIFIVVYSISNYDFYSGVNIGSFFNPIIIVLSFVLLPGVIYAILERLNYKKFLNLKLRGLIMFFVLYISSYLIATSFLNVFFNIKVYDFGFTISTKSEERYFDKSVWCYSMSQKFFPKIEDLPEYEDVFHQYAETLMLFFPTETKLLVVKYDEDTYQKEKLKLEDKYVFLDNKIILDKEEDSYIIPEHKFSIKSYDFKVVEKFNGEKSEFPKSFGMIGTSDEKRSIAYLYYFDSEQDSISYGSEISPMADLVKTYFRYDF